MRRYIPNMPFNVAMVLLVPTWEVVKGVRKPTFPDPDKGILFYGSFRTFGGTESMNNNVYIVHDTAIIDTWFRPEFKSDCRIHVLSTGRTYEIKSTPEDIEMRHQYLQVKVEGIGG